MKNIVLILMTLVAIISCEKQQEKTSENSEVVKSLAGKTLEYNYGDYIYQLNFKTENVLHWKCVKGDEAGKEADETYQTLKLSNQSIFISWIEKDGLGVSQVINFANNTVNTFLKIDKEIIPLSGSIKEL